MTDEAKLKPMDRRNEALLANVHPPAWSNPQPTGRYNMVVIGAGRPGASWARPSPAWAAR